MLGIQININSITFKCITLKVISLQWTCLYCTREAESGALGQRVKYVNKYYVIVYKSMLINNKL
jgi:hypothetical protein